jgi:hypothetical protein
LDRPEYRIGNEKWQKAEEILRVDNKARQAIGARHRGGAMVQPWARPKNPNAKHVNVGLRYRFNVEHLPSGELNLAIEQPKTFKIKLNDVAVNTEVESGWWCDRSLRRIPLDAALLRIGTNEILLECEYQESHPGFEIIYLLGNFGTRVSGKLAVVTRLPQELRLGDWCRQGLAFYSGSVTYQTSVRLKLSTRERLFIAVSDYRGVAIRIIVDGKPAGVIAWEPNEIDITDLVAGKKEIAVGIEVLGHRRNSHGPLHLKEKWPRWTGPAQFKTAGNSWFDGYQLVPCGLMRPPRLLIKKA